MPGLGTPALAALRRWRRGAAALPLRPRHAACAQALRVAAATILQLPELFFSAHASARHASKPGSNSLRDV